MTGAGDTIFAVSSGHGRAGVAVIRISGPKTAPALVALAGPLPKPRYATLRALHEPRTEPVSREPDDRNVIEPSGLIDRALVLWFPGPASFTGEDVGELHIHGGRAVIDATCRALGSLSGLRPAEPGEFTRRAFLNGKLDLTAAEGLADLVDAQTEAQRLQALRQAGGALATLYDGWRTRLIEAMALVEAELDFADEGDVQSGLGAGRGNKLDDVVATRLAGLLADMTAHLDDRRRGEILRDGFHVAIAGPPNAGKSSLLNALAQRDVAIVSPEAGTTRDIVETRLDLDGLPVIVSDTAGIRAATGAIEAEGVRRALVRAEAADLVLWVTDGTEPPAPLPDGLVSLVAEGRILRVRSKSDLVPAPPVLEGTPSVTAEVVGAPCSTSRQQSQIISVSASTGAGVGSLVSAIAWAARKRMSDETAPVPTRARHRHHVESARDHIRAALQGDAPLELRAEGLRLAALALGRITGRVDVEDLLDRIFTSFCIGK